MGDTSELFTTFQAHYKVLKILSFLDALADAGDISVLVAGTDGTDGPTSAAGGLIDGTTWSQTTASDALRRADAGTYLEQCGALFSTGPTNTNVMDLLIAIVD